MFSISGFRPDSLDTFPAHKASWDKQNSTSALLPVPVLFIISISGPSQLAADHAIQAAACQANRCGENHDFNTSAKIRKENIGQK